MNKSIKFKRDGNVYYPYPYYPVGFFYITDSDVSPASIYGGMWELLKDRFLLGCGEIFELGAIGGEINHTLTIAELAEHAHSTYNNGGSGYPYRIAQVSGSGEGNSLCMTMSAGENKPHNNMPPYLAVYIWHRVA